MTKILDLGIDDEVIIRIYNDLNDMTVYEEMKIKVEDGGFYMEVIKVKK